MWLRLALSLSTPSIGGQLEGFNLIVDDGGTDFNLIVDDGGTDFNLIVKTVS